MQLSEREWIFVNNLTYKIHAAQDFDKMRMEFLKDLRLSTAYRRASFYMVDKTRSEGLCAPVGIGFSQQQLNQYISRFESLDYLKTIALSPFSCIYRETDLFSDQERENSSYYKLAYEPLKIHYALLMALFFGDEHVGSVMFFREKEDGDFSDRDIYLLDVMKNHLSLRLGQEMGLWGREEPRKSGNSAVRSICGDKGLTERETEIIEHLYQGDTTAEICSELCIAQTTLKKHLTNAYKKLGIGCRSELYKVFKR